MNRVHGTTLLGGIYIDRGSFLYRDGISEQNLRNRVRLFINYRGT